MAEAKTHPTKASVAKFLDAIEDPVRRKDCKTVAAIMQRVTGCKPVMWGPAIVGFGRYLLTYANGRTAEWPVVGFSPRKGDLTLYLSPIPKVYPEAATTLGKHKGSKACLYINRLSDVDVVVLEELIRRSVDATANRVA